MTTKTEIKLPSLPQPRIMPQAAKTKIAYGYGIDDMDAYARAAVEADRQDHLRAAAKMMPSDEEIAQLFADVVGNTEDGARFLDLERDHAIRIAHTLLSRYSSGQPAASAEPRFCDRMYPDSNPDATCGDCPRDYRPAASARRAATAPAQAQPTMPALTDAMRAVLRNEHEVYESEDALYAALCDAAQAQSSGNSGELDAQDREDAERWKWLQTEANGHDFDNLSIRLPEQMNAYADAARAAKGEA